MIKKLLILSGLFVVLALMPQPHAFAQRLMGNNDPSPEAEIPESIDQIQAEIQNSQGVSSISEIDCEKVTQIQFERLGEAWMGLMHPDPEVHERMDRMMARLPAPDSPVGEDGGQGGEGSATLRIAHVNMGKNYLGCTKGIEGRWLPMMGMMGWGGMMNQNWSGTSGGWGSLHLLFGFVTWILLMALLVALVRYVWKIGGEKK